MCVRFGAPSEEVASMKIARHFDAGRGERRADQVDCADQIVTDSAGLNPARPAHQQRHADTAFIQKLLSAKQTGAVIAHEEHQRVIGDAFLFEPREDLAHVAVHKLDGFEIVGILIERNRMIGPVRWKLQLRLIDARRYLARLRPAWSFMAFSER